jgi:hypothetical protein
MKCKNCGAAFKESEYIKLLYGINNKGKFAWIIECPNCKKFHEITIKVVDHE